MLPDAAATAAGRRQGVAAAASASGAAGAGSGFGAAEAAEQPGEIVASGFAGNSVD